MGGDDTHTNLQSFINKPFIEAGLSFKSYKLGIIVSIQNLGTKRMFEMSIFRKLKLPCERNTY